MSDSTVITERQEHQEFLFAHTHSVSKSIKLWSTAGSSDEAATKIKSHTRWKNVLRCKQAKVTMNELCSVLKSEHLSSQDSERKKVWSTPPSPSIVPAASSVGTFCCGTGVGGGVSSGGLGWLSVKGNSRVTSLSEKNVWSAICQKRTFDQRNVREERLVKVLTKKKRLIDKLLEKHVWSTNCQKRTSDQQIVGKERLINKLSEKNVWPKICLKGMFNRQLSVEKSVWSTNCQKSTFEQLTVKKKKSRDWDFTA